jgi:hypothetical protein
MAHALAAATATAAVVVCLHAIAAADSPRQWGPAAPVDFPVGTINTAALEGCPIESPDAHYLFMASNRPGGMGGIDIWVAYRTAIGAPWSVPQNLPGPVNSAFDDFCPTPLTGGRLMFVSTRPDVCAGPNIYQTRLDPALGWLDPELLPCGNLDAVNSDFAEFSPSLVEADGRSLLFFSSNREGVHNIYSSELQSDGTWGLAVAVSELNSTLDDARPNVSHDGLEIVFDSTRAGGPPDIWTATRPRLSAPWSKPEALGPNVNSAAGESRPSLSRDGSRLIFGSGKPGGQGNSDIYVSSRRVPPGLR